MKVMKKLSAVLLSLCLLVPCFSMVVSASHGRISFTDPSTAVGEYVEVKCVVRSTSGNMSDVEVDLTYEDDYLRFSPAEGITDNGNGSLTCSGEATSAEVTFVVKFQALQEGTTKIGIAASEISDANGIALTLDHGSSTVTIAAGDASKIEEAGDADTAPASQAADQQIDVNGVTYTLTDDFADADIPNGYARTQRTLDGEERQMVENETGSIVLGYMTDADSVGDFFLYNEENATFSPYAEITISDMASIVVLSDSSQVSLPDNYQEAKLSLDGKEFPVWQDTESEGMYVLYAMNSNGETGFYQYDSTEGTYQRFTPAAVEEEEETDSSSILGKIQDFVEGHMAIVVLVVGLGGIIGLLILIILAVKLHNRNAELDELYDEYGIDLEEEEEVPAKKETKKSKKESKKARRQMEEEFEDAFEEVGFEEEFEEEEFEEEEFEEDEFEADEFEEEEFEAEEFEEFEDEDFEDFEDYREAEVSSKGQEEFTGYTERMDFTIDDLDELLDEKSSKKRGHAEEDDTFKMDFIDLD